MRASIAVVFGVATWFVVWFYGLSRGRVALPPAELRVSSSSPLSQPVRPALPRVSTAVPVSSARLAPAAFALAAPDEGEIMAELRELADSAPEYSLAIARDGNARFPNSPDAPERAWHVCKSLVNLRDFAGARAEAKIWVARYPDTEWTNDIARHLLVHPSGAPPP